MKLSHLLLEAVCLIENENQALNCRCEGNQRLSLQCFCDSDNNLFICEFLGLKKARATIAVTDKKGYVVNANEFSGDFSLSPAEYEINEKQWVEKCAEVIENL